jgi:hypothetical protein
MPKLTENDSLLYHKIIKLSNILHKLTTELVNQSEINTSKLEIFALKSQIAKK